MGSPLIWGNIAGLWAAIGLYFVVIVHHYHPSEDDSSVFNPLAVFISMLMGPIIWVIAYRSWRASLKRADCTEISRHMPYFVKDKRKYKITAYFVNIDEYKNVDDCNIYLEQHKDEGVIWASEDGDQIIVCKINDVGEPL